MNNNMEIYEYAKSGPDYAKKPISGGRLNGKTDIRPQWRTQVLTELFGPCGYGWKYEIVSQRLEHGEGKEVKAFVDINLYVKWGEEWSAAIPGIGGNSYIDNKGYTNDECFKMALTDALSVACKQLGIGADVYMGAERTKYSSDPVDDGPSRAPAPTDNRKAETPLQQIVPPNPNMANGGSGYFTCEKCGKRLLPYLDSQGRPVSLRAHAERSQQKFGKVLCLDCMPK